MGKSSDEFRQFHADNPHVYHRIVALAHTLWRANVRHYSMRGIFYVLRFESEISTTGIIVWINGEQRRLKLGNDLSPFYTRLVMHEFPRTLGTMFEHRESVADSYQFDDTTPAQLSLT